MILRRRAVCSDFALDQIQRGAPVCPTRHTFATQWLLAGGTDAILSKILGHVDTSLIHRVYAHFCDFDLVDAAAKIDLRLATKATKKATKKALPRVVSRRNGSKHENAIGQ